MKWKNATLTNRGKRRIYTQRWASCWSGDHKYVVSRWKLRCKIWRGFTQQCLQWTVVLTPRRCSRLETAPSHWAGMTWVAWREIQMRQTHRCEHKRSHMLEHLSPESLYHPDYCFWKMNSAFHFPRNQFLMRYLDALSEEIFWRRSKRRRRRAPQTPRLT